MIGDLFTRYLTCCYLGRIDGVGSRERSDLSPCRVCGRLLCFSCDLQLLGELAPGIRIWIHSDDIEWCRQQPLFQCPTCRFVDLGEQTDALHEMLVLSDASYVVMANSTYSWWISAFAEATQPGYRRAIMPGRWFAGADEAITRFFMRADILSLKPWG